MIKTIIIEDEEASSCLLEEMLRQHFAQVQVVATCRTLEEALVAIKAWQPDLVFSDIQLGDRSVFELFPQLDNISFEIIFATAYNHYAIQAIKCSAIDYLLKPFALGELITAMNGFYTRMQYKTSAQQFEVLFHNLKRMQKDAQQLALPTMNGLQIITLNKVVRCQAEANYTIFYLTDKSKIVVSRTLKEYDVLLKAYDFVRVHSAHLVNLQQVKQYIRGEGGSLVMADGSEIAVSRRKKEELMKRLAEI